MALKGGDKCARRHAEGSYERQGGEPGGRE
jgi:hypothetical protein